MEAGTVARDSSARIGRSTRPWGVFEPVSIVLSVTELVIYLHVIAGCPSMVALVLACG